jgi:DNA-binding NtrC family response regulator
MQRRILIVDDQDDLSSALSEVFTRSGYYVKTTESRNEAVLLDETGSFDVVITDLDGDRAFPPDKLPENADTCLPEGEPEEASRSHVKAFKICATNFRRDEFNEDELKHLFETVLNYKAQFVDRAPVVRQIREKSSSFFRAPSA